MLASGRCRGSAVAETGSYDSKAEALADQYYSDPAILRDLAGDRVYDAASKLVKDNRDDHNEVMVLVATALGAMGHPQLAEAMEQMIADHSK